MVDLITPAKARPKKGRPKAARIKDHWISFRVTAEAHFQIIDKAQRSGMGAGDYARSRTMRGIARPKKVAPQVPEIFGETTREIYHELRKQGVLLNQLAKHCNTYQVPPPPAMVELAATINALWRRLAP